MRHLLCLLLCAAGLAAAPAEPRTFEHGLPAAPEFFPIAVWLQSPAKALQYKAIGVNLYVGLWNGPTRDQLASLDKSGLLLICHANEFALSQRQSRTIVGWLQGDEPDNAQAIPGQKGWGPPIPPEKIVAEYQRLREADPTRPVLLNLGQGVAWDDYIGRGVRTRHPEDYAQYVQGCDIASFDIYPAAHESKAVAGRLEFVARGTQRLREWAGPERPVWACIGCTRISNPDVKPTPAQVKSEVWLAITSGARGLVYFCHQFKPKFIEAGLLADEEMAAAVGKINAQVKALAPVLNSPSRPELARCDSDSISVLIKRSGGATYVLTASRSSADARATFRLAREVQGETVEVLEEGRSIPVAGGAFADHYAPYEVHLYRISAGR